MKTKVALADLPAFCRTFVSTFQKRQLVLLSGPLGAGKTQFVKYCVAALGGHTAESPTFSIINEYKALVPVWHVDLYRLNSNADIESTGFWDLFSESEGVVFVEWSERVDENDFPVYWKKINVSLDFTEDSQAREIQVVAL